MPLRASVFSVGPALEGVIAGVLLYGGGSTALSALQAGAVATGLPFTLVLLMMCVSLYVGLNKEWQQLNAIPKTAK